MTDDVQKLVRALHNRPERFMIVLAGAGSKALAWLLGVPGASRTLVEALIPYDWAAFGDFLGRQPEQYVAADTARQMAGSALRRARSLASPDEALIGLACTATLTTDRPKRGEHRAHVATWQRTGIAGYSLHMAKGARSRLEEEDLVSRLILNAAADACELPERLPLPLLEGDTLGAQQVGLTTLAEELSAGRITCFGVSAGGQLLLPEDHPPLILSGAFNPLHAGHMALAQAAAAYLGQPLAFELAARNADKPVLAPDVVLDRLAQFAGSWPVYAGAAPNFVEKARLYPGTTFVIGYDTATRIMQPRYYGDDAGAMFSALDGLRELGCRFLVAGRLDEAGQFRTATSLDTPAALADLFQPLPNFREDISSTELRERVSGDNA
jgi:hypothetical protein